MQFISNIFSAKAMAVDETVLAGGRGEPASFGSNFIQIYYPWPEMAIVAALTGGYALLFIPLYHAVGDVAAALTVLPLAVAGWLMGMRVGVIAALVSLPLNFFLLTMVGEAGLQLMIARWPGVASTLVVGVITGRLSGLHRQVREQSRQLVREREILKREINERREAEEALQLMHEELQNMFNHEEMAKVEWERTIDCVGDMVILADREGRIKRCNRSVAEITGKRLEEIYRMTWQEAIFGNEVDTNAFYDLGLELFHKPTGRWFELKHYPFTDINDGSILGMVITIHDNTEMKKITDALEKAYVDLAFSQTKIVQQEKMASIGLLAAGVAHEINNPLGFIKCNLGMLDQYWVALVNFIQFQSRTIDSLGGTEIRAKAAEQRQELDVDHIMQDANELIMESLDGAERVRKIVQDLKTFSRMDNAESITANINECLASAVNIVWNELKYKATLKREYGDIPSTRCFPQQLNQVFMNLLVNAAHAIEKHGEITIRTWHADGSIFASVADTGRGIPEDQQNRVFEPFFTTKVVGEGTGLGLSITYDIIKKHNGEITVKSTVGCGTTFTVRIPIVDGGEI